MLCKHQRLWMSEIVLVLTSAKRQCYLTLPTFNEWMSRRTRTPHITWSTACPTPPRRHSGLLRGWGTLYAPAPPACFQSIAPEGLLLGPPTLSPSLCCSWVWGKGVHAVCVLCIKQLNHNPRSHNVTRSWLAGGYIKDCAQPGVVGGGPHPPPQWLFTGLTSCLLPRVHAQHNTTGEHCAGWPG